MNEIILFVAALLLLAMPQLLLKNISPAKMHFTRIILGVIFLVLIWVFEQEAKNAPKVLITIVVTYSMFTSIKEYYFSKKHHG